MTSWHFRVRRFFLVALAAVACKESVWTPMGSAELVLSEIKLTGGESVSKRIDDDERFGRSVMTGVATGDTLWLQVASRLTLRSAAAETSMEMALASALVHAPARVISMLGRKYPLEKVCSIPFLEADTTRVMAYHDSAAAAMTAISDTLLLAKRDSCRVQLDAARDWKMSRVDPRYIIKNKPKAR
jgi:hypothetical protein